METIQQQQQIGKEGSHHGKLYEPDSQPLTAEIWNVLVPEDFKLPSLSSFDGKDDPVEHITSFNTRMAANGAPDSLKCKLLAGTFSDATLCNTLNFIYLI